jgi:hypothetical protein
MSSLIIEVCRVEGVEKHPNADRMSICQVKGWRVCAGRDPETGRNQFEHWDRQYQAGHPVWGADRPTSELRRVVEENAVRPGRALDLGCGTGSNSVWLARVETPRPRPPPAHPINFWNSSNRYPLSCGPADDSG